MNPQSQWNSSAESLYLTRRAPVGSNVPDDYLDVVRSVIPAYPDAIPGYQATADFGVRNHWLDIRREGEEPASANSFKLFVVGAWSDDRGFEGWRSVIRTVLAALVDLRLPRLKICISPDSLHREDGVVLYLSDEKLAEVGGYVYGCLPRSVGVSVANLPRFAAPIPRDVDRTALAYVQAEGTPPSWLPPGRVYSSREQRALALERCLATLGKNPAHESCYDDPQVVDGMRELGYAGEYFHLRVGADDPITQKPLALWQGFFFALERKHEARDPEKPTALARTTGLEFGPAVVALAEDRAQLAEVGSQRKYHLSLPNGVRAAFRPVANRLSESAAASIEERGFENVVSPFWQNRLPAAERNREGFRALYEREIGSPHREVAASLLAGALDSRLVPTVRLALFRGELGSVQILTQLATPESPPEQWDTRRFETEFEEAQLLDFLWAATDRLDNWELTHDGHLLLLDNTQTFGAPGKYHRCNTLRGSRWRRSVASRVEAMTIEQLETLLGEFLTSDEIAATFRRIQQVAVYFEDVLRDLPAAATLVD